MTKVMRVSCQEPGCEWQHEEMVVESAIPPALMASFSEPERFADILARQRQDRIEAAVLAHYRKEHPDLVRLQ